MVKCLGMVDLALIDRGNVGLLFEEQQEQRHQHRGSSASEQNWSRNWDRFVSHRQFPLPLPRPATRRLLKRPFEENQRGGNGYREHDPAAGALLRRFELCLEVWRHSRPESIATTSTMRM